MLVLGYEDGQRVKKKIAYEPYLFVPHSGETGYTSIYGQSLKRIDFDSISEARSYISNFKDIEGHKIYGMNKFVYPFIYDEYRQGREIEYDNSLIKTGFIDIEVKVDGLGFPSVEEAENPVTLITLGCQDKYYTFGCQPFEPEDDDVTFILCDSEQDLLLKFVRTWEYLDPDDVSGWNTETFDMPYLINRICKILGEEVAKRLSPWKYIQHKTIEYMGKEQQASYPSGINNLDYLQLYKKFSPDKQESYKLDHIAFVELGEKKHEFEGTLAELEKDWPNYVRYNIKDTKLVVALDKKLGLIAIARAIAYDAGATIVDTFATIGLWDALIHHYLMDQNIVVDPQERRHSTRTIPGGFVKEPQLGMHGWNASFDLTALYPSTIMMYNISPETFVGKYSETFTTEDILNGFFDDPVRQQYMKDNNVTITPNGCMFRKDKQGFLPAIMKHLFNNRKIAKDKMLLLKSELEKDSSKKSLVAEISMLNNKQMSAKTLGNAGYGALANEFFRWFYLDFAEAITTGGQLALKWTDKTINQFINKALQTEGVDYVIYSDTDSCFIKLQGLMNLIDEGTDYSKAEKICKQILTPVIAKSYDKLNVQVNAFEETLNNKLEKISSSGIWVGKKKYMVNALSSEGVLYAEPKISMTGIEAIRTSTPQIVRDEIKNSISIIMNKDEDVLREAVQEFKDRFCKMTFNEIAFPRGVSEIDKWEDGLTGYKKGTPIHVRSAIAYNGLIKSKGLEMKYEPITNGAKIKFIYLKTPNPSQSNVIAAPDKLPPEFDLDAYIDYETQFEKTFLSPVTNILDHIGWQLEKKATLEDFFS